MRDRSTMGRFRNVRTLILLSAAVLCSLKSSAQDPLKMLPNNYHSIFDNDAVTVIRAHYGPREQIAVHDHPGISTIFVYLNDSSPVRIDHDGDKLVSVIRPPTVTGSFRVVAAQAERHSIENLGEKSSDFLRIELKQVSFPPGEAFRGNAPADTHQNLDKVEFTKSGMAVERIVCVAGSRCVITPADKPSLLVAFTPFSLVIGNGKQEEQTAAGAVHWLPTSEGASIIAGRETSAHLLRILLPPGSSAANP